MELMLICFGVKLTISHQKKGQNPVTIPHARGTRIVVIATAILIAAMDARDDRLRNIELVMDPGLKAKACRKPERFL
jgi:hypothetical protein